MRMNDLNMRKLPRFYVRHTKPTLFYSFVAKQSVCRSIKNKLIRKTNKQETKSTI